MKKITGLLILIFAVSMFSACSKIEKSNVDYSIGDPLETSNTIQSESPPPDPTVTTSDTSSSSNTDTSKTTTNSNTSNSNTSNSTTQKPTTTTKQGTTTKPGTTTGGTTVTTPPMSPSRYNPINYSVQKGVWITYIENIIVSSGKTEAQYRSTISSAYSKIKATGCNTVYVQVRSHADAYYDSSYFAKSYRSSSSFDQLEVMVEEAHKLGISIHAWINPMRGPTASAMASMSDTSVMKKWYNDPSKNGKYIVNYGGNYYFNPAYSEVRQLISNGIAEIVSKYNVDGIHIDDYFYPSGAASSFDASAYSQYGSGMSLADWRRSNTDKMVSSMYSTIKNINSKIPFGISPQGNNSNNYNSLYANVSKWCSTSGYLDYVVPQIYWSFNHPTAGFKNKCAEWRGIVKNNNIKLVIGLATYKVGTNEYDFNTDPYIMSKEINYAKTISGYGGVAFYRYDHICGGSIPSGVQQDMNNIKQALK